MTAAAKPRSRILEAVQETAENLQRSGFIDKRKQRQLGALCLEPIPTSDAGQTRGHQRITVGPPGVEPGTNGSLT